MPNAADRTPRAQTLIVAIVGAVVLVASKWAELHDAHFWDALGCYVPQARFIFEHRFDLSAYPELGFVRPPLYTTWLALLMGAGAHSAFALHLATCLLSSLLLPATYAVTLQLGGDRRAAILAVLLCAASPLFFAQAGLCQSDLPATMLATWGWALVLSADGAHPRRALAGAVVLLALAALTKESAYWLCGPAALLQLLRTRRFGSVLPFVVPPLTLLAWELFHGHVLGYIMPPVYQAAIAPRFVKDALTHDLVEGGRYALLIPASVWVRAAWRGQTARRDEQLVTAAAILLLPFAFPAPLPRYMMPTLPLLCALAALGLMHLERARLRVGVAVFAVLLLSMRADGWDSTGGHHLDQSLAYRRLLTTERSAVTALAAAHPRDVLAVFPIFTALRAPSDDGWLPAPVPTSFATPELPLAELCRHDFIVEAAQGNDVSAELARLREAGALREWRRFGPPGKDVVVWSIACPR
jgi:hypothetical protein